MISDPVDIGTANAASGGTLALTTTAAVPAGGKVFLVVSWFDSVDGVSGADQLTWNIDWQGANGSARLAILSADAPSGLASGTVITISFDNSVTDPGAGAMYSTGVETGNVAYGAVTANGTTAAWSSGTTPVTSGDILIGAARWHSGGGLASTTATGGNTVVHAGFGPVDGETGASVFQIGAGGSIDAQGTWDSAPTSTISAAVAYPAAAGGGATHPNRHYIWEP